jgi:uncharacterized protein YbaA (DUF1428 family)
MRMTTSDKWRKPLIHLALVLCLLSFFLLIWAWYDYKTSNTDEIILEKAKEDAYKEANDTRDNISKELDSTSYVVEGIAKDLSAGKLNDSSIAERLRIEMAKRPSIFSLVVAYSDGSPEKPHSKYFKWNSSNSSILDESSIPYDYIMIDNESTAWYHDPVNKEHSGWNSPYFGKSDNISEVDYSALFYNVESSKRSEVAGVVVASHSLETVRKQLGSLILGNTGYGFIFSEKGVIISYPVKKYLFRNIYELDKEDINLDPISKNMTDGEVKNIRTNQSSWLFQEKILSTNWTLGVVLPVEETLLDKEIKQNCSVIRVVLMAFSFIFFLCLLLVSLFRYEDRSFWLLAFIFSFLCLLGMGIILHLTLNVSPQNDMKGDHVVFDMADVETVLQHSNTSQNTSRIPTGVFIQSLEFSSAYNVIMTGYIWQNISNISADYDSPSFNFPESEEITIEKDYEAKDKGVVGWRFKTTLRQEFDYSRYPFDREDVWIRIWNNASSGGVLVPDFDSYDSLNPESLPGLERSLVLEGWEPQRTYFSYRNNFYNTNFGVGDFTHSKVSELYYNFDIKRDFKSPFTSYILPVIVVAILLFAVLMITTKDEKKEQCGFSSSDVLGYCSALFFVLIVAHASLRDTIPMDDVIYLEYFYFIMYLAILAVSLNSIAFASSINFPFIDTKDNLYVKVLYWPVVMGFLLLITLMNFY